MRNRNVQNGSVYRRDMNGFKLMLTWAAAAAIVIAVAGCDWQTPQEVQVKTEPAFDLPAGTRSVDIADLIDLDELLLEPMQEDFGEDGTVVALRPQDDGVDTYTVQASRNLISISTADFFEDEVDLSELEQDIERVEFDVPSLEPDVQPVMQNIEPIELASEDLATDGDFEGEPAFVPDGGGEVPVEVVPSDVGFESATFAEGTFVVDLEIAGAEPGHEITVAGTIVDGAQELPAAEELALVGETDSGLLSFDLSGVTLSGDFSLRFDVSGDQEDLFTLDGTYGFDGAALVTAASGVDLDGVAIDPVSDNEEVSFDLPDNVAEVEVDEGEVRLYLEFPAWDGIAFDVSAELTGLVDNNGDPVDGEFTADPDNEDEYFLPLDGVVIDHQSEIDLNYTITATGGAETSFDVDDPLGLQDVALTVESIARAVVEDDELAIEEELQEHVDQEIVDAVESITLEEADLVMRLNNRLPVSVILRVSSEAFLPQDHLDQLEDPGDEAYPGDFFEDADNIDRDGTQVVVTFPPQPLGDQSLEQRVIPLQKEIVIADLLEDAEGHYFDFQVFGEPEGYDDGAVTVENVVPGETYSFGGSGDPEGPADVELVLTVESIMIQDQDEEGSIPDEDDDPMDFSELREFLPEGVTLDGVTGEIRIGGLEDFSGSIQLVAGYIVDGTGYLLDLLDADADRSEGSLDDNGFAFDEYSEEAFVVGEGGEPDSVSIFLDEIINDGASDVEFRYLLSVDRMELFVEEEDADDLTVAFDLTVPFGLQVDAEDDTGRVLWELTDDDDKPVLEIEDDLFDRETDDEDEGIQDLLDQLAEVALIWELTNDVGLSLEIDMVDGDDFAKTIRFHEGTTSERFELSRNDIRHIRDTIPFQPEINFYLTEGAQTFDPDATLLVGLWARIAAEIDYTISLGNDD